MRRRDAILATAAGVGFLLLVAAAFLYEPMSGDRGRDGPAPAPAAPPPLACGPCLSPYDVALDAAAGHTAWRWDRGVVVSSLDVDQATPVMGIAWTRGEDLVLEAAVLHGSQTLTRGPIQAFVPLPAAGGRAYLPGEGNVTSWDWRLGTTRDLAGMRIALDAADGRVLGHCGDAWCIMSAGTVTPLEAPGIPGRAAGLAGDIAYATQLAEDGSTMLYRFPPGTGAAPEPVATGDIVRVAAAPGHVAWERPGGDATLLVDGVTTDIPGAARIAWAGDRLAYTTREGDQTVVMLYPDQELARFAPREDVQALAATATHVWVAGTVFMDHTDVDVLLRIPIK